MSWQIAAHIREMFVDFVAAQTDGAPQSSYFFRTVNRKDQLLTGLIEALSLLPKDFNPENAELFLASDLEKVSLREKWGPPIALLTTEGFENLLEIGNQQRQSLFGLQPHKIDPLVPRDLAFGVTERTSADGSVEIELDEKEIEFVMSKLGLTGTKSVAVCFLHSRANPAHELQVAKKLSENGYQVTLSHTFEGNELERAQKAAIEAFLTPLRAQFLEDVTKLGFAKERVHLSDDVPPLKDPNAIHLTFLEDRLLLEKNFRAELFWNPLSRISKDNGGLVHVGPEKIDGEPGPVCFGKGLNLSLFDLLVYAQKITCDGIPRCRIDVNRVTRLITPLAKQLRILPEDCASRFIDLACSQLALEIRQIMDREKIDMTQNKFTFSGWLEPLLAAPLAQALELSQWQSSPQGAWSPSLRLLGKSWPEKIMARQGLLLPGSAS